MNYTDLVQLIQDMTENTETTFVSHIPDFVRSAEGAIAHDLRIPALRKNQETSVTQGTIYIEKLSTVIATHAMSFIVGTTHNNMVEKDIEFIREAYPDTATTGTPQYWAEFSETQYLIGPAPSVGGTLRITGYFLPASIVDEGTTWIGNNAPNALLYGALREAYIYMKGEDDVLSMYSGRYQDEINMLKGIDVNLIKGDEFHSGQRQVR